MKASVDTQVLSSEDKLQLCLDLRKSAIRTTNFVLFSAAFCCVFFLIGVIVLFTSMPSDEAWRAITMGSFMCFALVFAQHSLSAQKRARGILAMGVPTLASIQAEEQENKESVDARSESAGLSSHQV